VVTNQKSPGLKDAQKSPEETKNPGGHVDIKNNKPIMV